MPIHMKGFYESYQVQYQSMKAHCLVFIIYIGLLTLNLKIINNKIMSDDFSPTF